MKKLFLLSLLLLTSCFAYSQRYDIKALNKEQGLYEITSSEDEKVVEKFVLASNICPRTFRIKQVDGGATEDKTWVYAKERNPYWKYLITCTE